MNNMHKIIVAFLATSSIALGITTASAEGHHDSKKGHEGKTWHRDAKENIAARHERLHKALNLTAAQEPAWQAFIAKAAPEGWEQQRPDPKELDKLTAPERLEKSLELSQKRQEFLSQRLADLKVFYAQLSPEQQKTFDKQHRGHGQGHPRRK
ncbi:hypothetical protein AGMMS49545_07770 [Betaproteobacteria bacterium]|nr:hypothetical protein AGMMS49545_07770 [Betaproteobacteria bacterium]GHU42738.1 hypothetical protein AGMMS50289_07950 [Betaproteobacteria bacterium]